MSTLLFAKLFNALSNKIVCISLFHLKIVSNCNSLHRIYKRPLSVCCLVHPKTRHWRPGTWLSCHIRLQTVPATKAHSFPSFCEKLPKCILLRTDVRGTLLVVTLFTFDQIQRKFVMWNIWLWSSVGYFLFCTLMVTFTTSSTFNLSSKV